MLLRAARAGRRGVIGAPWPVRRPSPVARWWWRTASVAATIAETIGRMSVATVVTTDAKGRPHNPRSDRYHEPGSALAAQTRIIPKA